MRARRFPSGQPREDGYSAVYLHIDRVVIEGMDGGGGQHVHEVQQALVEEMTLLLTGAPAWTRRGSIRNVLGPAIELPVSSPPEPLGRAIARSVHACLSVKET
jgi:hypothetical protein